MVDVVLIFESIPLSRTILFVKGVDDATADKLKAARGSFDQDWLAVWVQAQPAANVLRVDDALSDGSGQQTLIVHSGFETGKVDIPVGPGDDPPPNVARFKRPYKTRGNDRSK